MSFIKNWTEGLDIDVPGGQSEVKPVGDGDVDEGVTLGNLGAKIVGTLFDWVSSDGGFLVRVKNSDVMSEGIDRLREVIQDFNRRASRLTARSAVGSKGLRELQSRWFFTVAARLSSLKKGGEEQKKGLEQLTVLAPKLEAHWSKYMTSDEAQKFGIRVTNPEIINEPSGAPEEESVPELPEPEMGVAGEPSGSMEQPVDAPGVMDGAPSGTGLGRVPPVGLGVGTPSGF